MTGMKTRRGANRANGLAMREVEFLANYVTFGDTALAEKALRQFAQGQYENGSIPAMCPAAQGPLPMASPPSWPSG